MLRSSNYIFQFAPIFLKDHKNMSFHGNKMEIYSSNFPAKNVLLTFQMEQNGMFLENSKYDHLILHKKLDGNEIHTFFHKFTHISLNIGPRLSDPHTPEYPFPLAGHIYAFMSTRYRYC